MKILFTILLFVMAYISVGSVAVKLLCWYDKGATKECKIAVFWFWSVLAIVILILAFFEFIAEMTCSSYHNDISHECVKRKRYAMRPHRKKRY